LNGKPFFKGNSEIDQLQQIFQITGSYSLPWLNCKFDLKLPVISEQQRMTNLKNKIPLLSRQAGSLLNELLEVDFNNRITAKKALQHFYFNGLRSCTNESPHRSRNPHYDPLKLVHFLKLRESCYYNNSNLIHVSVDQCATLVDWMTEIVDVFNKSPRTVFLAIDYFIR